MDNTNNINNTNDTNHLTISYYVPQIEDPNHLSSGLNLLYAINRSFTNKERIKANKKNIIQKNNKY